MTKTNAMRQLDKAKIKYEALAYEVDESDLSGMHIVSQINIPAPQVFKTLVARGEKKGICVFCIPVDKEVDLKKAAIAAGEKRVELVAVKELLGLTGYIRGGCSPVGMKKKFPTFIEESALSFETITVSAGVRGCQLLLDPRELINFIDAIPCHITS